MSKKPTPEKITARINYADGNSMTFTANGSVIGGMVEILSWLPADRRVKALERLQAMHEDRLKVEAERAAEATKDPA